jgi:hypothetical protein
MAIIVEEVKPVIGQYLFSTLNNIDQIKYSSDLLCLDFNDFCTSKMCITYRSFDLLITNKEVSGLFTLMSCSLRGSLTYP